MKRFEDQFKDAFEHFEPEVDPKLWQHISRELPSAQVNPVATNPRNGLLAKIGVKTILGLVAAATITVLSIWYFSDQKAATLPTENNTASVQEVSVKSQQETQTVESGNAADAEAPAIQQAEKTSYPQGGNPSASSIPTKETVTNDRLPEKALTGDLNVDKGESNPSTDSPSSQKTAVNVVKTDAAEITKPAEAPTIPAVNIQKTEKPVLILSSKGGFAPLTITALHNQNGIQALFDFGDGTSLKGSSASHTFTEPGIYTILCEINGLILEQKVEVIGQIPTAFSPNGDGVNDYFKISDLENISIEIRIYNRTGKLMFNAKGSSISWDGRSPDGQNADAGTYLYDIFATSDGGSSYKQKGTIHLFR